MWMAVPFVSHKRSESRAIVAKRDRPPVGQWDEEQSGLFLEGDERPSRSDSRHRRPLTVAIAVLTCLTVVGLPLGFVFASGGPDTTARTHHAPHDVRVSERLGNGPAEHQVLSALSATTASGNFDVSYALTESPGSGATSTTATTCVSGPGGTEQINGGPPKPASVLTCGGPGPENASVTGKGTIDTSPYAMAVSADVSTFGDLSIRVDGTDVWELGTGDNGLAPQPSDNGPGSSLSSFAGLVEGTLGRREGDIAMLGMASPTGFLDLSQQAVTGATEVGTGQVGGVAVTEYDVSIDLSQLANVPGITSDEATTIQEAVTGLDESGYSGTTVKVAIDGAGFVREVTPEATFSDGGQVTLDATFTNFGCAGTVLMPGQQGATSAPTGCASPDSTTTTTTAAPASQPATTPGSPSVTPPVSASTSTTVSSPSTTGAGSGDTTTTAGSGSTNTGSGSTNTGTG